jgi:hypothetical protein
MACIAMRGGTATEADHYLRFLWVRADQLLNRDGFWPQVVAVADALLERERLTFQDVQEILHTFLDTCDTRFFGAVTPELCDLHRYLIRRGLRRPRRK